ncbi:MAG: gliding motility-associated C-terminal domain-containing protein [Gemmatimonadota bacterium]
MVLLLACSLPAAATRKWVVGGTAHPWAVSGELEAVDATSEPGWIQPIRTTPSQNLALADGNRVPLAYSLQPSIQSLGGLGYMIDGDPTTAFEMTLEATVGSSVILDLGAIFPVSQIRFYPRQDELHGDRFLRAYQVYVTDRSLSPQGQILWDLIAPNWDNGESIVRLPVGNRYVRDVRIQAVTNLQWEIAEWEVYGQGFAPSAVYTSEPIDLGGPANFGALTWAAESDPGGHVSVVTRSGTDPTPYTYYQLQRPEEGVVDTVEVARAVYNSLAESDRYRAFDPQHWSFWSAPYSDSGQDVVVSPAPRRYLQFQIEFSSGTFTDRARVDSVVIEYSAPPVARAVIGEVSPALVPAGEMTTFRYAVTPTIEAGDTGFDALTVSTPLAARMGELWIDGVPSAHEAEVTDDALTVHFPLIRTSRSRLEMTFDCQVLVFGTVFSGIVFDSRSAELPQEVVEGDASPALASNQLSVGITELGQEVLGGVRATPNPFTPNGDGVSDATAIRYQVRKLLLPGRVVVSLYTLAGARVWTRTLEQESGLYAVEWDGRRESGELVPPGVYLYRLSVSTASGGESQAGTVCVVY